MDIYFALLTMTHLQLFSDMHMNTSPVKEFQYSELSFVDMGMSLLNEDRNETMYFIKVSHVHITDSPGAPLNREVYLMAINADYI